MSRPDQAVLEKYGVISKDEQPMEPSQFDMEDGVPVVDIATNQREQSYDFMVYDNVTSPDGMTLIQNEGTQYAVKISEGGLQVVDRRENVDFPFGLIGVYKHDYYIADRQLVKTLESMCK